jgi:outer membrane protein assembly factor BamB
VKSRLTLLAVTAAAILLFGGTCGPRLHPPEYVSLPGSVFSGETAWVRLATSGSGYGTVRYVMKWDDASIETTGQFQLTDTATVWHVWTSPDTVRMRAAVYPIDEPARVWWAEPKHVFVVAGGTHAPVIDTFESPPVAINDVEYSFIARAHDPDGDSIRIHINWGDGHDTTSEFLQGRYQTGFYPAHTFTQVETARVVFTAQDEAGATSLPETALVSVDTTGGVIWSSAPPYTSPLVVNDGVEDCVYFMPPPHFTPGAGGFLALTSAGDYRYGDGPWLFATSYCAVTQHIVGWDACILALDRQLHLAWRLSTPDSMDYSRWTQPAVCGNRIYIGDNDSLFCFIDSVDHGGRIPAFTAHGAIVDAPAVDAQWAVYFGTDSGYLYKVGPWLDTAFWRVHLAAGKIHSPVVGRDGTIYCASESQSIYAIDPATGTTLWTAVLDGQALRPAVGRTAIFVGTTAGKAYSIDPATGGANWVKVLGSPDGFSTAPVLAADGRAYFQSDGDVLYLVKQDDGSIVWQCDCSRYYVGGYWGVPYPGKGERPTQHPPNPTILPNGNVIVAGVGGLYCVAGSRGGTLDPLAPWPKWQHDLYNTGYVGGGR